ncbi:hypothetical protein BGZ76_007643, partial [Entomortierella beljakovae]
MGQEERNSDNGIPRRSPDSSTIQGTSTTAHRDNIASIEETRIPCQGVKVTSNSNADHQSSRIYDKLQDDDPIHPKTKDKRPSEGSTQDSQERIVDSESPLILHRKSARHDGSNFTGALKDPKFDVPQEPSLEKPDFMDGIYFPDNTSQGGTSLVDRPSPILEWPVLDSQDPTRRDIHRCIGDG